MSNRSNEAKDRENIWYYYSRNKGSKRPLEKSAHGTNTFFLMKMFDQFASGGLGNNPQGAAPPPPGITRRCRVFGLGLINIAPSYMSDRLETKRLNAGEREGGGSVHSWAHRAQFWLWWPSSVYLTFTLKKAFRYFHPQPGCHSRTKLSLGGNNDVIYKLFPPRESVVSDTSAGDGNIEKLFLQCMPLPGEKGSLNFSEAPPTIAHGGI